MTLKTLRIPRVKTLAATVGTDASPDKPDTMGGRVYPPNHPKYVPPDPAAEAAKAKAKADETMMTGMTSLDETKMKGRTSPRCQT